MKLNLNDSVLDKKGKEGFLTNVEQFTDIFSLRDEIGTCPFIEVHLKLKDETSFFVRPYSMREEQKKVIQKEMDRLKHLGIIRKGLTSYSSPAFKEIKKLLIHPPVLKAPTPDGLFRLESDTSREGVGGTLLQRQGDEWVVIGYHSKRHFGITKLK